jgi:predicted transporter
MPCPVCGTALAINILQSSLVGVVGVGVKQKLEKTYLTRPKSKESKAIVAVKKSKNR